MLTISIPYYKQYLSNLLISIAINITLIMVAASHCVIVGAFDIDGTLIASVTTYDNDCIAQQDLSRDERFLFTSNGNIYNITQFDQYNLILHKNHYKELFSLLVNMEKMECDIYLLFISLGDYLYNFITAYLNLLDLNTEGEFIAEMFSWNGEKIGSTRFIYHKHNKRSKVRFSKKGDTLIHFLETGKILPPDSRPGKTLIFYIDDNRTHIEDYEKSLFHHPLYQKTVRFGVTAKKSEEFKASIAKLIKKINEMYTPF